MTTFRPPANLDTLLKECDELGVLLPHSSDHSCLSVPIAFGDRTAPNRFVALPMEGCDCEEDGTPSPLTFRRYARVAEGGSGTIWFEATAVCPQGRSNRHAMLISDTGAGSLARLVESTRRAACRAGNDRIICLLQLTHAGRYGYPSGVLADPDSPLSRLLGQSTDLPVVSDDDLSRLQESFAEAAILARDAGFDGVDIKSCHGYLFSELLSARSRPGKYGGEDLENRTRLLLETIASVRDSAPKLMIACRLNVYDGIPNGWGVAQDGSLQPCMTEPLELAGHLACAGVSILGVTLGYPRFDGHFGRPSARMVNGVEPPEHPLLGIERMVRMTGEIQRRVPQIAVTSAGLAWLGIHALGIGAGMVQAGQATLMGQGRGSFAYPEVVRECTGSGDLNASRACRACSLCSELMRYGGPTGCVVRDGETYKQVYQAYRKAAK